ncbi:MAG: D-tyrosyl-tRNA(Tyr) deacylase [Clostridiales bacterium]|nr:D-tyrosyl-tRNA(Tyr) deacylase [Clostridiales bacterium]
MKFLVQKVSKAEVRVDNNVIGKINKGFMILIGIHKNDTIKEADKLISKVLKLRIFEDENDKLNLNIKDIDGEILAISQFTLYGNTEKGNRPSFINAAKGDVAEPLYDYIVQELSKNIKTEKGKFGAFMEVDFINEGPVTIILEEEHEK